MALATDIREARKIDQVIESGKVLLVRKDVGELVKTLRRYDKNHLRAAKGAKTYPDREKILRLFHVCDAIHRLLEAETKATDFQMLGLKYEEMWKQADAALAGSQTVDR
jgi:arginine/lysine/ornithine decarboxylase